MKIQPNAIRRKCACQIKVNVKAVFASIQRNFVTIKLIASMTKSFTFVVSYFYKLFASRRMRKSNPISI